MQSLQMRWPVPGHIGLSTMTSASAPMRVAVACAARASRRSSRRAGSRRARCRAGSAATLPVLVAQALRARVLVALVAEHAVVDLAQHLARRHARVGQLEAVAAPQRAVGPDHRVGQLRAPALDLDEVPVVEVSGKRKTTHARYGRIVQPRGAPALQRVDGRLDGTCLGIVARLRGRDLAVEQHAARARHRQLAVARELRLRQLRRRSHRPRRSTATCAPPLSSGSARRRTKSTLKRNRSSCARVPAASAASLVVDPEQPRQEAADVRRHPRVEERHLGGRAAGRQRRPGTRPTVGAGPRRWRRPRAGTCRAGRAV